MHGAHVAVAAHGGVDGVEGALLGHGGTQGAVVGARGGLLLLRLLLLLLRLLLLLLHHMLLLLLIWHHVVWHAGVHGAHLKRQRYGFALKLSN